MDVAAAMDSPIVPPEAETPMEQRTEVQILLELVKAVDRIENLLQQKPTAAQAANVPAIQSTMLDNLGY